LKEAYNFALKSLHKEAALIYMELAEQGIAVAQLNAAILLDKYDIIDSSGTFLHEIMTNNGEEADFNINKHLSFKYYSLAALQKETEDEANLKLGDFFYYG
jgi:TPR repeat protein